MASNPTAKKTATKKSVPAKKATAKKATAAPAKKAAAAPKREETFVDRATGLAGDVQAFVDDATEQLQKLRETHQDTHTTMVPARDEQGLALAHRRTATAFGDVEAALTVLRTAGLQMADEAAAVPQP